ncbi:Ig-like domain-containing protein [Vibrio campbellii]
MKSKFISFLILLFTSVVLVACGGESSSNEDNSGIDKAPIYARDSVKIIEPDQLTKVSILPYISVGEDGAQLVSITDASGSKGSCDVKNVSNTSFEVNLKDNSLCHYDFVVESVPGENEVASTDTGTLIVLGGRAASILVPEEMTFALGDEAKAFEIDASLVSKGYSLDSGSYSQNPEVASVSDGTAANTLLISPVGIGVSHIVYSIAKEISPGEIDRKIGVVSVAVSDSANVAPEADNFTVTTSECDSLSCESISDGEDIYEISVSGHISDADDGVENLQLVNVFAFDVDDVEVTPVESESLNNQKFLFKAKKPGTYDVTYVVYDHRTGYGIGIVRVVVDPGPVLTAGWSDVWLHSYDGEFYLAPWEKNGAETNHIYYSDLSSEEIDGKEYEIVLYDSSLAEAMCFYRGLELPTSELLSKLYDHGMAEVPNYGNWPKGVNYWTSSENDEGNPLSYSLVDNTTSVAAPNTPLIATCVQPGTLELFVEKDGATIVNASTIDDDDDTIGWTPGFYNTVKATITRKSGDGTGVADAEVTMRLIDEGGEFDQPNKPTSIDGSAQFNVRSDIEGELRIAANYLNEYVEASLHFVGKIVKDYQIHYQKAGIPPYGDVVPEDLIFKVGQVFDFIALVSKDGELGLESEVDFGANWESLAPVGVIDLNETTGELTVLKEGKGAFAAYYSKDPDNWSDMVFFEVFPKDELFFAHNESCVESSKIEAITLSSTDKYSAYVCKKDFSTDPDTTESVTDANVKNSDDSVLEISHVSGKVDITGLSGGSATISATKEGMTDGSLAVTVIAAPTITYIEIDPESAELKVGEVKQLNATAYYSDGTSIEITSDADALWSSGNETVATVEKGSVTAKSAGSSSISVNYDSHTASANIVVVPELDHIEVRPNPEEMTVGEVKTFTAVAVFTDTTEEDITDAPETVWSTDDDGFVISADKNTVTAIGNGSAKLTATYMEHSGSSNISVTGGSVGTLTKIEVRPNPTIVGLGQEKQLEAYAVYTNESGEEVSSELITATWIKLAGDGISLTTDGVATGLSTTSGEAIVQATYGELTAPGFVQVEDLVDYSSLKVTPSFKESGQNLTISFKALAMKAGVEVNVSNEVEWRVIEGGESLKFKNIGNDSSGEAAALFQTQDVGNAKVQASLNSSSLGELTSKADVTVIKSRGYLNYYKLGNCIKFEGDDQKKIEITTYLGTPNMDYSKAPTYKDGGKYTCSDGIFDRPNDQFNGARKGEVFFSAAGLGINPPSGNIMDGIISITDESGNDAIGSVIDHVGREGDYWNSGDDYQIDNYWGFKCISKIVSLIFAILGVLMD